jgi:hypothetical protein
VLYKDAAHSYDDDQVIVLTKERVSQLSSRLIPVQAGDKISLSTYVHYSSVPAKRTWQKIGAAAAGLAIGSLPHLLDRNKANQEGGAGNDLLKKAAPLAGAGVAALPFVLNKRKAEVISKNLNMPMSKNGWFVPDVYLSYTFYDLDGKIISSEARSMDKHAKDAWQQLSLQAEAPQDGYVQVEVGNGSKRPVWMDGIILSSKSKSHRNGKVVSEYTYGKSDSSLNIVDNPITINSCYEICTITPYGKDCYIECDDPDPIPPCLDCSDNGGSSGGSGGTGGGDYDNNEDESNERKKTTVTTRVAYSRMWIEGVGWIGASHSVEATGILEKQSDGNYKLCVHVNGLHNDNLSRYGTVKWQGNVQFMNYGVGTESYSLKRETNTSYLTKTGWTFVGSTCFKREAAYQMTGEIKIQVALSLVKFTGQIFPDTGGVTLYMYTGDMK